MLKAAGLGRNGTRSVHGDFHGVAQLEAAQRGQLVEEDGHIDVCNAEAAVKYHMLKAGTVLADRAERLALNQTAVDEGELSQVGAAWSNQMVALRLDICAVEEIEGGRVVPQERAEGRAGEPALDAHEAADLVDGLGRDLTKRVDEVDVCADNTDAQILQRVHAPSQVVEQSRGLLGLASRLAFFQGPALAVLAEENAARHPHAAGPARAVRGPRRAVGAVIVCVIVISTLVLLHRLGTLRLSRPLLCAVRALGFALTAPQRLVQSRGGGGEPAPAARTRGAGRRGCGLLHIALARCVVLLLLGIRRSSSRRGSSRGRGSLLAGSRPELASADASERV
eukprot:m.107970 g.107970  ORF g.107970 m.107970 type:complete len:338 (+) comp8994_c0_seq3:1313-2326(+)